jgi:hypothetical protein
MYIPYIALIYIGVLQLKLEANLRLHDYCWSYIVVIEASTGKKHLRKIFLIPRWRIEARV